MVAVNQALPTQTHRLVAKHLGRCQHLGLTLDRFAPWAPQRDPKGPRWDLQVSFQGKQGTVTASGGAAKGPWLKDLIRTVQPDADLIRAQRERWRQSVEARGGIIIDHLQLTSRLLVGLGASHVLETALTLDRTSGAPLVPGSACKGLARTYALYEVARELGIGAGEVINRDRKKQLEQLDEDLSDPNKPVEGKTAAWFRAVFGTLGNAGEVCFVGGIYAGDEAPQFVVDVMTPHFPLYYRGGPHPPADNDNPNPVAFLAVEAGNPFWFGLLPRRVESTGWLDVARGWLIGGLTRLGAGGKTAAGYGFFSEGQTQ